MDGRKGVQIAKTLVFISIFCVRILNPICYIDNDLSRDFAMSEGYVYFKGAGISLVSASP